MKKYLPILLLLMTGSAVHAGAMTTRHQSSIQSIQSPTITHTQRTGNSYSVSGSNVTTSYSYTPSGANSATTVNGGVGRIVYNSNGTSELTNVTASQGIICTTGCGDGETPTYGSTGTFSFSNSYTQGDANNADGTNKTVTTGATGNSATPGTISNGHSITLGGSQTSGTTVTGQFITEISIFN